MLQGNPDRQMVGVSVHLQLQLPGVQVDPHVQGPEVQTVVRGLQNLYLSPVQPREWQGQGSVEQDLGYLGLTFIRGPRVMFS